MHDEAKEAWLAALRSGRYEQTKGRLRDNTGAMCCLGVMCDVVNPDAWKVTESQAGMIVSNTWFGAISLPPDDFTEALGLDSDQVRYLATLNDDLDCNFQEIADYIEDNL
jgi:hypothetical protein